MDIGAYYPRDPRSKKSEIAHHIVFLGGIPLTSTFESVKRFLEQCDEVKNLVLPRDKLSGKLKGYARALLATNEGIERLMSLPSPRIDGLLIGVSKWKSQSEYLNSKDLQGERKIFVKFPAGTREEVLWEHFSTFGQVVDIDVKTDPSTNRGRNFCYVLFEDQQAAKESVSKQRHRVNGKIYRCEMSKPPHLAKIPTTAQTSSPSAMYNNKMNLAELTAPTDNTWSMNRSVKGTCEVRGNSPFPHHSSGHISLRRPQDTNSQSTNDCMLYTTSEARFTQNNRPCYIPPTGGSTKSARCRMAPAPSEIGHDFITTPTASNRLHEGVDLLMLYLAKPTTRKYALLERKKLFFNHHDLNNIQLNITPRATL